MAKDTVNYTSPLVERNASPEMAALFGADKKFSTWRRLWLDGLDQNSHLDYCELRYGGYYNTTNNYYGSGYDSSSSSSSGLCDRLAVGFVGVAIIGLSMAFLEKVFFTRDRFSILSQKSSRMHPLIFKRVSSQNKRIQNSLVKAVSDVYRFARTKLMVNRGYQIAGIEGIVAGAMCLISAFLSCEMMASMLSVALVVAGIAFAIGVFTWGYDKSINHSYISTKEDVKRSIKLLDNSLMYSNIPIINITGLR